MCCARYFLLKITFLPLESIAKRIVAKARNASRALI